jgi:hypothetical protein
MPIPNQAEYESNERHLAHTEEQRIEKASLLDRKEAQAAFLDTMATDPATVAERISWLLEGNYGYGQMQMAKQVLASPRMNREAALIQLAAVFDWLCPRRMAADAWKKLTAPQKKALSAAITVVISEAERNANDEE